MPRAKSVKTSAKGKDAQTQSEPQQIIDETRSITINNSQVQIITNNNNQPKPRGQKVDLTNHWTKDPLDERWLYVWHYNQQLVKVENKFIETANWNEIKKINSLWDQKTELLANGIILDCTPIEELKLLYYTGDIQALKNLHNRYFQPSYFKFANIYEPGEIIEEVSRSSSIRGRKPLKFEDL